MSLLLSFSLSLFLSWSLLSLVLPRWKCKERFGECAKQLKRSEPNHCGFSVHMSCGRSVSGFTTSTSRWCSRSNAICPSIISSTISWRTWSTKGILWSTQIGRTNRRIKSWSKSARTQHSCFLKRLSCCGCKTYCAERWHRMLCESALSKKQKSGGKSAFGIRVWVNHKHDLNQQLH